MKGDTMLRVYVFLRGEAGGVEVHMPPVGQTLGTTQQGRRVHLWWNAGELEDNDPRAFQVLTEVVPGTDHVVVARNGRGGEWDHVMEAVVVESGADSTMVQVTGQEVHRTQPQVPGSAPVPQQVEGSGVSGFFAQTRAARDESARPQG